jgi:hypothetical protein
MVAIDEGDFGGGWRVTKRIPNPWGYVPHTGGGKALTPPARAYLDRLLAQQRKPDTPSRRHHYVPQAYLRQWSSDGRRVWSLNTDTGTVKLLGIKDVCVKENFYRVVGADDAPHNRVELLFGVVDTELRRVQRLFNDLSDPESLEFDDLLSLGITMAVQRMRTLQQRRIQLQYNAWMVAQDDRYTSFVDNDQNPHQAAGIHTEMLFRAMWDAADVLIKRQIEVWYDPKGRFMTCDAPILVPFRGDDGPSLLETPYIIWPVSPQRVVVLSDNLTGEKAVMRRATSKLIDVIRDSVVRGREQMIFATEDQLAHLPPPKRIRRRMQARLRCSDREPNGNYVPPPGCCIKYSQSYASAPDVDLCQQGLHSPAPDMSSFA